MRVRAATGGCVRTVRFATYDGVKKIIVTAFVFDAITFGMTVSRAKFVGSYASRQCTSSLRNR